jgi:hypothetical protein
MIPINRRSWLATIAGFLGLGTTVKAIEKQPVPLALVVELDDDIFCGAVDDADIDRVRDKITKQFKGGPPAPIIVLAPGLRMRALTAHGELGALDDAEVDLIKQWRLSKKPWPQMSDKHRAAVGGCCFPGETLSVGQIITLK